MRVEGRVWEREGTGGGRLLGEGYDAPSRSYRVVLFWSKRAWAWAEVMLVMVARRLRMAALSKVGEGWAACHTRTKLRTVMPAPCCPTG